MTPGQVAKLKELARCSGMSRDDKWQLEFFHWDRYTLGLNKQGEAWLRRLWHQYQPQIRAMRKNRAGG